MCLYLLWFNFILGLNLILYQSHHHTFPYLNTMENNIETKNLLSHNIYSTLEFLFHFLSTWRTCRVVKKFPVM